MACCILKKSSCKTVPLLILSDRTSTEVKNTWNWILNKIMIIAGRQRAE